MMKWLCLFSLLFHMAAGCVFSGGNNWLEITGHERGSVLLPCSCSDLHSKPQSFTWKSYRTGHLTEVLNEEHYRGRLQMFNNISAANLSLLISDLKEEDGGDYRCSTEKGYKDFWLNVKGCELVKKTVVEEMTGIIGESVVLPCFCTDLQDDLKTVTWEFNYQEIYHEQTRYRKKRMKLVSKIPPGNLSLIISDLTEEDQGIYTCSVQDDKKKFRLYVKERKETTTQPKETDKTPPSKQPQSKLTNSSASLTSTSSTQGKKKQEAPRNPPPASSLSTQGQTKQEAQTKPPPASSLSTQGQKPQETPRNPPPAATSSTQVQKPQEAPKKPPPASSSTPMEQDEHQNYSIVPLLVVLLLLMFVLVAFICWRCRGARSGAYMITANRLDFFKRKQEDQLVTGDTLFTTVNYTCDPTDPH